MHWKTDALFNGAANAKGRLSEPTDLEGRLIGHYDWKWLCTVSLALPVCKSTQDFCGEILPVIDSAGHHPCTIIMLHTIVSTLFTKNAHLHVHQLSHIEHQYPALSLNSSLCTAASVALWQGGRGSATATILPRRLSARLAGGAADGPAACARHGGGPRHSAPDTLPLDCASCAHLWPLLLMSFLGRPSH